MFKKIKTNFTREEGNAFNRFAICRWLSSNERYLQLANQLNAYSLQSIETYDVVKPIKDLFKTYMPYPKSNKEKDNVKLKEIAEKYQISLTTAEEYLEYENQISQ